MSYYELQFDYESLLGGVICEGLLVCLFSDCNNLF